VTTPLQFNVELTAEQIESIARRAAEIVAARAEPPPTKSPYLSVSEAADFLRTGRQRIDNLLSEGLLTRIKDGNRTLIARQELDAYLLGETRSARRAGRREAA
jgi:excisionase family DNA binding protein